MRTVRLCMFFILLIRMKLTGRSNFSRRPIPANRNKIQNKEPKSKL